MFELITALSESETGIILLIFSVIIMEALINQK
jgi:hypothetical protein